MAQHDYVISNGTGAAVRSDLNNALLAIVSNNSGATAPSPTYAYQLWADTTTNLLKLRNGANSGWITIGDLTAANLGLATLASPTFTGTATIPTLTVSTSAGIPLGSAASPTLFFTGDTNTGLYSPGADQLALATGGSGRLFIGSTGKIGVNTSAPSSQFSIGSDTSAPSVISLDYNPTNITAASISANHSTGQVSYNAASAYFPVFYSNNTERLRITSSGLVGIGTGASTPGGTLEVKSGAGVAPFVATGPSSEYARIDSSGRLLVGTSSVASTYYTTTNCQLQAQQVGNYNSINIIANNNSNIYGSYLTLGKSRGTSQGSFTVVNSGDSLGGISFEGADGSAYKGAALIECYVDATPGTNDMPGRLVFSTTADGASSPTERVRINSLGFFKASNTGSYFNTNTQPHEFCSNISNWTLQATNSHTSPYGLYIPYSAAAPNGGGNEFIYCSDTSAARFLVKSNGGINNYSGNNVNLSDEREKKNIVNLDSTWDCLKHWELKKFHYNEDADTDDLRYGVIAQQVAEFCPEVISEWVKQKAEPAKLDDAGNEIEPAKEEIVRMGVKDQQMMWMAIKALQEAQVRIEELEAKVATLEAK